MSRSFFKEFFSCIVLYSFMPKKSLFFQICLEPSTSRRMSVLAFPCANDGVKDLDSLMFQFSRQYAIPQEMLYILRNLIDLTIQKGVDNTKLEYEKKVFV